MFISRFLLLLSSLSFVFIFGSVAIFDLSTLQYLGMEDGFIETFTAISLCITALIAGFFFFKGREKMWLCFSLAMFLACARELDLHKEWTHDSIFKSRFYLNPDFPLFEKVIGGIVILSLLYIVFTLLKKSSEWMKRVFQFDLVAWCIGFGLGMFALGKMIDSMSRIIPSSKELHDRHYVVFSFFEESFELLGALSFLTICIIYLLKSRQEVRKT